MKATIETISPNGNAIQFETPDISLEELLKTLPSLERKLAAAGYQANTERHYPKTPDGLPICPKHGEVMKERNKQGDTWYSHQIRTSGGQELYCRGHAGKSSPGWDA